MSCWSINYKIEHSQNKPLFGDKDAWHIRKVVRARQDPFSQKIVDKIIGSRMFFDDAERQAIEYANYDNRHSDPRYGPARVFKQSDTNGGLKQTYPDCHIY